MLKAIATLHIDIKACHEHCQNSLIKPERQHHACSGVCVMCAAGWTFPEVLILKAFVGWAVVGLSLG